MQYECRINAALTQHFAAITARLAILRDHGGLVSPSILFSHSIYRTDSGSPELLAVR